ncbi:hypothetical protein ACOL29_11150 [Aliarcobacter butzleri]
MKRTAFEKDSNSPLAELFLAVRDYVKICIGNNVIEKQNENTTTFFTKDGGYCYIKAYDEYIHIGWLRGKHLKDKYSLLSGTAKTIRGQKIVYFDKTTRETIRYYVEQTVMFLIEYNELKKIRNHIKNKIQLSL